MKLLPAMAGLRLPSFLKKLGLNQLCHATAAAFGCSAPSLKGLSFEESLSKYARFTREEAEKAALCKKELPRIQARLYGSGYQLGRRLRQVLHLTTLEEVLALSRILYRTLEIDFQGNSKGEITISRCFFSSFYSPGVCEVISALDQGMVVGLAGGGQLEFYQRITEGAECCKACLLFKKKENLYEKGYCGGQRSGRSHCC